MSPMRIVRNRMLLALSIAALAVVVAVVALSATIVYRSMLTDQFRDQTVEQCRAIEDLKEAIRMVFQDNLAELDRRRDRIDRAQYGFLRDYYRRQLNRFAPTDCPSP